MSADLKEALDAFERGDLDRARRLAEQQISTSPSSQWDHLLGLIYCRIGDAVTGVDHLRRAAEAEPGNSSFQLMLARALIDSGRAREVLERQEPPPITSRSMLELWRGRAEAASAAGDHEAAVSTWSKVAAAAPRDWRARGNLGSAFAAQRRWPEAIETLMNAAQLNPGEPSLRWSLGAALAAADRHEEAIAALEDFEQLVGATGESAVARGRCLLALARFAEAEAAYRNALQLSPGNADVFRELGLLFERTNRLDLLAQLLENAAAADVPGERLVYLQALQAFREARTEDASALIEIIDSNEDLVRVHRLKAKVADRLGKSEEAFAAATAMNRATPDFDLWHTRGAHYRRRLRELTGTLTRTQTVPRLPKSDRKPPAFLVGFPRSGTTLLDTFLMGHCDTVVLEEVHLLGVAERQIGNVADLPNASLDSLERARDAYFAALDLHVPPGFNGLVIDKLPLNLLGAPFIQAMFPGAPIIFAQRHPCDAVLSAFMQSFVMNDAMASFLTIDDAADLYDAVMSGWRVIREGFPLNVHAVVYERLVEDSGAELGPLIEFLGLPWDEQLLAHTETARERGAIITASYDQVTEPLNMRAVGRWRRYEKQLEPVLPVLLPWAERLGYRD